jgi:hypothetical protein
MYIVQGTLPSLDTRHPDPFFPMTLASSFTNRREITIYMTVSLMNQIRTPVRHVLLRYPITDCSVLSLHPWTVTSNICLSELSLASLCLVRDTCPQELPHEVRSDTATQPCDVLVGTCMRHGRRDRTIMMRARQHPAH